MSVMKNKLSDRSYGILGYGGSFLIPAIIVSVAFLLLGIYPGGKYTPLILDLASEHFPFYNFLNSSAGMNSLCYQDLGGLGSGIINSLQMYTGPFVFVFALVPALYIPYVVWGMIIFQIGLCGLAEYVYLKKGYPDLQGILKPLLLSVCYSLMSCAVIYTIVPVWLWGIVFLPLVMYGLDLLIDERKNGRFILFLSLSIVFNYLTAYIIIIFSFIYFLYRMYLKGNTFREFLSCIFRYFICGVLSVALTAVSWLPVLCDLIIGKAEENRHPRLGFTRNPLSVIAQIFFPYYDGLGRYSLPFIFCGLIPLILMIVFLINKKTGVKKKIAGLVVICFFVLSFSIGLLDIVWMFFAEPNGYPSRYSFVFSFFIILLAADALKETDHPLLLKPAVNVFVFVFVISECLVNSTSLLAKVRDDVGPYSEYSEYVKAYDSMELILSAYEIRSGYDRVVKNWRLTNNDGILFGYSDIDYFSSSYNSKFHEFMGSLGFNTRYHILRSEGITPVVASALGVTYFVEYGSDLSAYYKHLLTAGDLDVFKNSDSMPVMFSIESVDPSFESSFSDDPFRNINEFIYDLSGVEGVFDELDHSTDSECATVFVDEGRDLWMYAVSDNGQGGDIHGLDDGETDYVYYNGIPLKAYGNYLSPYCVSLGFGAGDYATFTFDEKPSDIYFASMNETLTSEAISVLQRNAASGYTEISSGFSCDINLNKDKYVLVTLPYDKGFKIRDNGKPIDYYAYKGALICFKLECGKHHIELQYVPSGLTAGAVISLTALLVLTACLVISAVKNKKKRIIHEDR